MDSKLSEKTKKIMSLNENRFKTRLGWVMVVSSTILNNFKLKNNKLRIGKFVSMICYILPGVLFLEKEIEMIDDRLSNKRLQEEVCVTVKCIVITEIINYCLHEKLIAITEKGHIDLKKINERLFSQGKLLISDSSPVDQDYLINGVVKFTNKFCDDIANGLVEAERIR